MTNKLGAYVVTNLFVTRRAVMSRHYAMALFMKSSLNDQYARDE
jgi:hypothetical protein